MRLPLLFAVLLATSTMRGSVKPETEQKVDALIQNHQTAEAVALIQTTLAANPDWQPGLWRLGNLFFGADRYVAAREAFTKLTSLDPRQGAPWSLLGLSDFALHDYAAAIDHIQHGLALGFPAELELGPTCYLELAESLLAAGKFDRVLVVLTGLAGQTDSASLQRRLAGLAALRIAVLPDDAGRLLQPQQVAAVEEAGAIVLGVARSEIADASPRWMHLIDAGTKLPGLRAAYGKYLLETGNPTGAVAQFRADLEGEPGDVNARLGLGFALMETGALDEAIAEATRGLELEPNSANAHYLMGSLHAKKGDADGAQKEFEASRDLDPNLSRVHYALAQVYLKQHRSAEASREAAIYKQMKANEESFRSGGRVALESSTKEKP